MVSKSTRPEKEAGSRQVRKPAIDMSFFHVPLMCEAAPHIGCGTIARPVLTEVERESGVLEVWLNREGTVLAVVWAAERRDPQIVVRALSRRGVVGIELAGAERQRAFDTFAPSGWYRPTQLQELSAEEAKVIAARLVARLSRNIRLTGKTTRQLGEKLGRACADALAGASADSVSARREQVASALLNAGRQVLDAAAFKAFEAVVSLGHRALPGEK